MRCLCARIRNLPAGADNGLVAGSSPTTQPSRTVFSPAAPGKWAFPRALRSLVPTISVLAVIEMGYCSSLDMDRVFVRRAAIFSRHGPSSALAYA
jgi:hypothetical protein